MLDAETICREAAAQAWKPEPRIGVGEWAEAHRILYSKSTAEPGPYRLSRIPYMRGILECLSTSNPCRRIVFMKGSQIGATEAGNCWLGYTIHTAPGPFLYVCSSLEDAEKESKMRVGPMLDLTPVLQGLVAEARSRDSGNTIMLKEYPGGLLSLVGANSPKGLRRMPCRYIYLDEVDAYPGDVGGEGNPIALAEKRTATFKRNRKIFLSSTPGIEGLSIIEPEFLKSDQRRFFVPCPHCGNMDWIRWPNIRWEEGRPETAALYCEACQQLIEEGRKTEMLESGEWRATAEGDGVTAGFHLSSLYSPLGWLSWGEVAIEFIASKNDPSKLLTWTNTILGETWKLRGTTIDPDSLLNRRERYPFEVPPGVLVLLASVDVQGDRLEVKVKGYGAGEESWLIAYEQIAGDPGQDDVWFDLDKYRAQTFDCGNGRKMMILRTGIDAGGKKGHTDRVYQYCQTRRGVVALKGTGVQGQPLVGKPSRRNQYKVPLLPLCVDTGKTLIYERLKIKTEGAGFMHFPEDVDSKYFEGLLAEKPVWKLIRGRGIVKEWKKVRERNEPLDLENYALATLYSLGESKLKGLGIRTPRRRPDDTIEAGDGEGGGDAAPSGTAPAATTASPRSGSRARPGGWVSGWKGGRGGRGWGKF